MTRLKVLGSRELWVGEMRQVRASGTDIVLLRLDSGLYAYEDRCAHLGVPISRGVLDGEVLVCSAHHYTYDAKTGCGLNPCNVALKPVVVHEEHEEILVEVPTPAAVSRQAGTETKS